MGNYAMLCLFFSDSISIHTKMVNWRLSLLYWTLTDNKDFENGAPHGNVGRSENSACDVNKFLLARFLSLFSRPVIRRCAPWILVNIFILCYSMLCCYWYIVFLLVACYTEGRICIIFFLSLAFDYDIGVMKWWKY